MQTAVCTTCIAVQWQQDLLMQRARSCGPQRVSMLDRYRDPGQRRKPLCSTPWLGEYMTSGEQSQPGHLFTVVFFFTESICRSKTSGADSPSGWERSASTMASFFPTWLLGLFDFSFFAAFRASFSCPRKRVSVSLGGKRAVHNFV